MHGRCGLFHSGFFDKKGENTMAFKMILAVNFTPDRLKQFKLLGMLTKSQVKAVTEEEKEETVGKVLGLTEEEVAEIAAMKDDAQEQTVEHTPEEDGELPPVTKEAIVLCGFTNQTVNLLLDAIRRGRLKNIPLKAMVTPTNISWRINTILQELNKEHEYFKNMKKKGK